MFLIFEIFVAAGFEAFGALGDGFGDLLTFLNLSPEKGNHFQC